MTRAWGTPALDRTILGRRGIGNYVKLIADALTRVAFVDDSQIVQLSLTRGALDRANPRAEITVGAFVIAETGATP